MEYSQARLTNEWWRGRGKKMRGVEMKTSVGWRKKSEEGKTWRYL